MSSRAEKSAQNVEGFNYLIGGQERRRDDEQHRDHIESQQSIAEADAARHCALVKPADSLFYESEGHGDIFTDSHPSLQIIDRGAVEQSVL